MWSSSSFLVIFFTCDKDLVSGLKNINFNKNICFLFQVKNKYLILPDTTAKIIITIRHWGGVVYPRTLFNSLGWAHMKRYRTGRRYLNFFFCIHFIIRWWWWRLRNVVLLFFRYYTVFLIWSLKNIIFYYFMIFF